MRVRAFAIASPHSNTVGTVEVECTAAGLALTYIDAARIGDEGVPIAFDRWQQVLIDWSFVRQARFLGSALAIDFELPSMGIQRCVLVHFSSGHDVTLQEFQQKRLLLRLWTLGTSVVLASAIALSAPRLSPTIGPLMGLLAGLTFAALLVGIGARAERFLSDGGRKSKALGELFANDLLAFVPNIPREPSQSSSKPFSWPKFDGILPRTTLAISLTLAGALLAALIMFRWIFMAHDDESEHFTQQPTDPSRPTLAQPPLPAAVPRALPLPVGSVVVDSGPSPTAAPVLSANAVTARVSGPCQCQRADSLLWSQPLPRVSLIVLSSRRYKRHEHDHVEVEFAAINNSDKDISELTSMAEFFQQDPPPSSKLVSISTRAVYFQGPLRPGEAIKWHVDAEGSTFRLHPAAENGAPITGSIEETGSNAAPTNAIANLLKAHNRPVRLHGAMLLAFLRDPRAKEATVELGDSLRESESSYLRRLLEALSDLRMCQIQVAGSSNQRRVLACVFNATDTPRTPVEIIVRALDATVSTADPVGSPPQILAEKSAILTGGIPAKSGVFVQIDLDFSGLEQPPAAFEAMAQVAAAQ